VARHACFFKGMFRAGGLANVETGLARKTYSVSRESDEARGALSNFGSLYGRRINDQQNLEP
jgi:hypothetical protein